MDRPVEFEGLQAELTERVLAISFQVSNELGSGFFESVYKRAMMIALRDAGFKVLQEVAMPVWFRGQQVGVFSADLVVNDVLILELKVGDVVTSAAEMQLRHYLRSCPIEVGLVLVFGERVRSKRVIFTNDRKKLVAIHP